VNTSTVDREQGIVHKVKGPYCWVSREWGGAIFLHQRNVAEAYSKDDSGKPLFFVNQTWRYAVEPHESGDLDHAWTAIRAVETVEYKAADNAA